MLPKQPRNLILKPFTLIAILSAVQLFITLLSVDRSLTAAESMWHYIGRNWFRHGLVPYSGGVDNKSPLIFAIFGLSDRLLGVNYWFPRVLGTVCQSVGLFYMYRIAKYLAGEKTAILAVTVYGLSLMWKLTGGIYVSFTETYDVTFILISFYLAITAEKNKSNFISGLFGGVAFCFRFSAGFALLAIFISTFIKNKLSAVFFLLGVLVSVVLVVIVFYFLGINMHELFVNMLTDNFGPGSATDHGLSWRLDNFMNSFCYAELILFYPFMVFYFLFPMQFKSLAIWLICAFIGVNVLGIYAREHFKDLLPVMAIMSGLALAQLTETYRVPFKAVVIMVWIVFFPKIIQPYFGLKHLLAPAAVDNVKTCGQPVLQPEEIAEKRLGLWLKANTKVNEKVFVAGFGARVQVYSERLSPTIYFNVTQTERAKKSLFRELAADEPAWILIPEFPEYATYVQADIRGFIDKLVAKDYTFTTCLNGYGIYRKLNASNN